MNCTCHGDHLGGIIDPDCPVHGRNRTRMEELPLESAEQGKLEHLVQIGPERVILNGEDISRFCSAVDFSMTPNELPKVIIHVAVMTGHRFGTRAFQMGPMLTNVIVLDDAETVELRTLMAEAVHLFGTDEDTLTEPQRACLAQMRRSVDGPEDNETLGSYRRRRYGR